MSEIDPLKIIGSEFSEVVDKAKVLIPFDPSDISNQSQQTVQNAQQAVAQTLSNTGDRAFQIQQKILPQKKLVTFWLEYNDGNRVRPEGKFKAGYEFTMKINPSSIKFEQPPKTVVPVRTMGGWVMQHWYPELGTLGFSGQIGNMLERWNTDTRASNRWKEFQKLVKVYMNNGVSYAPSGSNRNSAPFNPVAVCIYEGKKYKGYFETFSFSEEEDQPYTRNYDFSMKYSEMIDTSDISALTRVASVAGQYAGYAQRGLSSINGIVSKFS